MYKSLQVKNEKFTKRQAEEIFGKNCFKEGDFKPLKKPNGKDCDDVDLCVILDEVCTKMDEENHSGMPTNYGFDPEFVSYARAIAKAHREESVSKKDLFDFNANHIDINK